MNKGDPYGPINDGIGALFWLVAAVFFSAPFWVPVATFVIGWLVGKGF